MDLNIMKNEIKIMKDKIKYGDSSLTLKGVEYLNLITADLKQDTFWGR